MSEALNYDPIGLGVLPLATNINAVVGTTPTVLSPPGGTFPRFLVLVADKGGFRVRRGSVAGAMPATEFPAASVTNNLAGLYIPVGVSRILPAAQVTVVGYAADSALTYYWL